MSISIYIPTEHLYYEQPPLSNNMSKREVPPKKPRQQTDIQSLEQQIASLESKTPYVTNSRRVLNFQKSPSDVRDHIITITAKPPVANQLTKATSTTSTTSTTVDLAQYCTSIKDQGYMGSCTAYASIGAIEYLVKKYLGKPTSDDIFSERFTYYATRVNVLGWEPEDSGAYIRDTVKSIAKFGTCREVSFPYVQTGTVSDYKQAPSPGNYTEALKYQALRYAKFDEGSTQAERMNVIRSLKANLAEGFPIIGGFVCFSNIWSTKSNGVIPVPNGQIIGGHAILLVGYDDNRKVFKFKNSWGASWGEKGYGYLPYDYFYQGLLNDLWSVYYTENDASNVGINISNPSREKQQLKEATALILAAVAEKIDDAINGKPDFFNDLRTAYKNANPKIQNLIATLQSQMKIISS